MSISVDPAYSTIQHIYNAITLPGRSFRVLVIEPSAHLDNQIVCTLQKVDLDSIEQKSSQYYEALSYTWGDPNPKQSILLHGLKYEIGCNCFEALKKLRWTSGVRRLFVDAICINQNDIQERGRQIALMGAVYSKAFRVLAWLGDSTDSIESAMVARIFRDFRILYLFKGSTGKMVNGVVAKVVRWLLLNPILPMQETFFGGISLKLWFRCINVPYFERVWTLQETALSQRCILVLGKHKIRLEVATFAISFMEPHHKSMVAPYDNPEFLTRWHGFDTHRRLKEALLLHRSPDLTVEPWVMLQDILAQTHLLKASNVKDKLYALYGILHRLCEHKMPTPVLDLPPPIVWMQGSIAMIKGSRSLRMLRDVINDDRCRYHRHTDLCSWRCATKMDGTPSEPRWTFAWDGFGGSRPPRWQVQEYQVDIKVPTSSPWDQEPQLWSAQYGLTRLSESLGTSHSLAIQGVVVDVICGRSLQPDFMTELHRKSSTSPYGDHRSGLDETMEGQAGMMACMAAVLYEWAKLIRKTVEAMDAADVFRDLMMFEMNAMDLYGPNHDGKDADADFRAWYNCLISPGTVQGRLVDLVTRVGIWVDELTHMNGRNFHMQFCILAIWKCLFTTAGGYVGYTWYTAESDDLVVLLCWGHMPAILRPVRRSRFAVHETAEPERYLLIGFAYVHGFMDCSAWDMQEGQLQEFIIM